MFLSHFFWDGNPPISWENEFNKDFLDGNLEAEYNQTSLSVFHDVPNFAMRYGQISYTARLLLHGVSRIF
jgi:hypothetical protein